MADSDTLWHIEWGDGENTFVIAPDKEAAIEKMPDGKDLVNSVVKLDGLYNMIFKAGYDKCLAITEKNYLLGKKHGRREVGEWVEKKHLIRLEREDIWQTQLKIWGIQ